MSIFAGMGGGFGGRFDPDLSSKIDQLMGKEKTREEKLAEQLRMMGVDPNTLPLKPADAIEHTRKFLEGDIAGHHVAKMPVVLDDDGDPLEFQVDALEFVGSSLGFSRVVIRLVAFDYDEYDSDTNQYKQIPASVSIDKRTLNDEDTWTDLERSFKALSEEHGTRFVVAGRYRRRSSGDDSESDVSKIEVKVPKSVKKLVTGQTARIQKGDELVYVKKGGLFNDDDLVILETMQPIQNVTGWTVVEVIEE